MEPVQPSSAKSAEILVLDEQEERLLGLELPPSRGEKVQQWLDETYGPLPTVRQIITNHTLFFFFFISY